MRSETIGETGDESLALRSDMESVRIAYVRYLNTLPLVEGLGKAVGIEMIPAAPAQIAGLVASGAVDVGLASVIDAAASDIPLTLLPVGMIGCEGPTLTVGLFSPVPPQRIEIVFADTESHTSVALCRVLLHRRYGISPEFVAYHASEPGRSTPHTSANHATDGHNVALLLIGDKVVTQAPDPTRFPHRFDLGACWRDMTDLPFVYAVWMCRSAEVNSHRVTLAADILDRQRRRNAMRHDWIIDARAASHGWPTDLARTYLTDLIRHDIDDRARLAVHEFLSQCEQRGLVSSRDVSWADEHAAALIR